MCDATIHRDGNTWNISPPVMMRVPGKCSRNGSVKVACKGGMTYEFCKVHARLFAEGFIDPSNAECLDPVSVREIRKYGRYPRFIQDVEKMLNVAKRQIAKGLMPPCDCCGQPIPGDHDIDAAALAAFEASETDGPGSYICGRTSCDERTNRMAADERFVVVYEPQRAENEAADKAGRNPRTMPLGI